MNLFTLIASFMYGLQNDSMIEIIIVRDSILIKSYMNIIKFEKYCNMSIVGYS